MHVVVCVKGCYTYTCMPHLCAISLCHAEVYATSILLTANLNLFVLRVNTAAIECEPLDAIANGVITYADDTTPNFDLGTTATYACNEGYFLDLSVGVRVRTCVDDGDMDALGVFTDQAPSCVRKSVCASFSQCN